METVQITTSKPQQIEPITIELDVWDSYNNNDLEISYGDDYLQLELKVYQTVERIKGNHLIPDNQEVKHTIIRIENLRLTDSDGDAILMTDDKKRSIEREIENAIIIS